MKKKFPFWINSFKKYKWVSQPLFSFIFFVLKNKSWTSVFFLYFERLQKSYYMPATINYDSDTRLMTRLTWLSWILCKKDLEKRVKRWNINYDHPWQSTTSKLLLKTVFSILTYYLEHEIRKKICQKIKGQKRFLQIY